MKKTLILIFVLQISLCLTVYAERVSLSKEQFENLSQINESIIKKYPQFKGMSGSQEEMEILGISAKSFNQELAKLTFKNPDDVESDRIRNKKSAIDKLKALGLTDEDLTALEIKGE